MAFSQDLNTSKVTSEPLVNGKPAERKPMIAASSNGWAIGVALVVFGMLGWIAGAKYTLDGWIVALNWFLGWLSLPVIIPSITGWFVLICVAIGLVYSRAEIAIWKARNRKIVLFWIAWILIAGTDVITTYLGARYVQSDSSTLAMQVASMPAVAVVWSIILTFAPEYLIVGGVKFFKR